VYVVIAGAGEVGRALARALRAEGHDIVVVEKDPDLLEPVKRMDVLTVIGGAASPSTLKAAGAEKANLFLAVTDHDEVNLLACSVVKSRNPQCRTVARVNGLDYMREPVSEEFKPIGCDLAVCPELVAARRIARILELPGMADAEAFAKGRVQVAELRLRPGSKLANTKLKDAPLPRTAKIVALFREDDVLVPGGADTLKVDDRLVVVVADPNTLREVQVMVGDVGAGKAVRGAIDRVMVVGATRVGVHLCRVLQGKMKVTLIERDRDKAQAVTDALPEVLVIHGDAADRETLHDEGIEQADAMVACEERDEFNILTSLLAKQLGVPRVMSVVHQVPLKSLAERIGIDLAVSPRQASIGAFLRVAHAHAPARLSLLAQGEAQLMEFDLGPRSRLVGEKLRKAGFPQGSIVGAILRGNDVLIPGGEDHLQANDTVVVFALTDVAPKVHKLF
jgi:trk system potassium uptake protein